MARGQGSKEGPRGREATGEGRMSYHRPQTPGARLEVLIQGPRAAGIVSRRSLVSRRSRCANFAPEPGAYGDTGDGGRNGGRRTPKAWSVVH